MKILVLSQYWAPENGVPQRRWAWLSKKLVAAGHEVVVIAPPPHYQRKMSLKQWARARGWVSSSIVESGISGETIYRSGFFPAGPSLTRRIFNQAWVAGSMLGMHVLPWSRARRLRPDVVIGTVPALPTATVATLVAKLHKVPHIIDLRDAWPDLLHEHKGWNAGVGEQTWRERILSKGPLQLLVAVTEKAMYGSLRSADTVITTSERLAEYLKKESGVGGAVATIRNVFPPKTNVRCSEVHDHKPLHVLYAGTVGRAQQLDNAVRAVKLARDAGVDVRFRVLGDGAAWDAARRIAAELGVDADIRHRVPAEELHDAYAWADTALVHLTDWDALQRAIPSKTYELMDLGIHISGVVAGEAASLIEELGAGHVVAPEDPEALARMWGNLAHDRSLLHVSDKGRDWVEHERDVVVPQRLREVIDGVAQRIERRGGCA